MLLKLRAEHGTGLPPLVPDVKVRRLCEPQELEIRHYVTFMSSRSKHTTAVEHVHPCVRAFHCETL